ncbi:MAG: O-antigen ligase family protein [Planctomycetaceae bacterium]|nr:O-antigen ligase family protein [Planctomycetaceae bacterium]
MSLVGADHVMQGFIHGTGKLIRLAVVLLLTITVAGVPWMLGGVVPAARLWLLAGAIAAAVGSITSGLLCRRPSRSLPWLSIVLLGLAAVGTIQLRLGDFSVSDVMTSTAGDSPADVLSSRSLIPSDTRSAVAMFLALSLIAAAAFDQVRTPRSFRFVIGVQVLNGVVLGAVSLVHRFQDSVFLPNEAWLLQDRNPFGTFVNPNNAAGWFCLCVAAAVGQLIVTIMSGGSDSRAGSGRERMVSDRRALGVRDRILQAVSEMRPGQILALLGVVFPGVTVLATQSRGGILALVTGTLLGAAVRTSRRRLPAMLLLSVMTGAGTYAMLTWLNLHHDVVTEMETLQDLPQAAGGRPQHWRDSLRAVIDFPLLGTGLGSYQYAELPYQRVFAHVWFRNADNQFVEAVVEGGTCGLILFLMIGVTSLMTGIAGGRVADQLSNRNDDDSGGFEDEESTTLLRRRPAVPRSVAVACTSAIAVALPTAAFTQAVSGFFDFGIGLPAALSLFVLLSASSAGLLHELPAAQELRTGYPAADTPARFGIASLLCVSPGPLVIVVIQVCLLSSAAAYLRDQRVAVAVDRSVVEVHRTLQEPMDLVRFGRIENVRRRLEQTLQRREDDAAGLEALREIVQAEMRRRVLLSAYYGRQLSDADLANAWRQMTLYGVTDRFLILKATDEQQATVAREEIERIAEETGVRRILESSAAHFAVAPGVHESLALLDLIRGEMTAFRGHVQHELFVQNSNAEWMFRMGVSALRAGDDVTATELWNQCLRLTTTFQPQILVQAGQRWADTETVLQKFGPRTYVDSVTAAQRVSDKLLRERLWEQATQLWNPEASVDETTAALRIDHLLHLGQRTECLLWLSDYVQTAGAAVALRIRLAELLQQEGQLSNALAEWYRVLYYAPDNKTAQTAVARLTDPARTR